MSAWGRWSLRDGGRLWPEEGRGGVVGADHMRSGESPEITGPEPKETVRRPMDQF